MRSQESNYMYSSFTKLTIKNQNTQLTEKSVGITIRMFPDYPIEKSQYPINKTISGYYPIYQNFLSGALGIPRNSFGSFYLQNLVPGPSRVRGKSPSSDACMISPKLYLFICGFVF